MTTTKQGVYIGDGTFIPGIPRRTLSYNEWVQFRTQIEAAEKASNMKLYNAYEKEPANPDRRPSTPRDRIVKTLAEKQAEIDKAGGDSGILHGATGPTATETTSSNAPATTGPAPAGSTTGTAGGGV